MRTLHYVWYASYTDRNMNINKDTGRGRNMDALATKKLAGQISRIGLRYKGMYV